MWPIVRPRITSPVLPDITIGRWQVRYLPFLYRMGGYPPNLCERRLRDASDLFDLHDSYLHVVGGDADRRSIDREAS